MPPPSKRQQGTPTGGQQSAGGGKTNDLTPGKTAHQPTSPQAAKTVTTKTSPATSDRTRACSICLQRPLVHGRHFGLLENCIHVFCAGCIAEWMADHDHCPVCRVRSTRCLLWPKYIESAVEKNRLLSLAYHFYNLSKREDGEERANRGTRVDLDRAIAARARSIWITKAQELANSRGGGQGGRPVDNELREETVALEALQESVQGLIRGYVHSMVRARVQQQQQTWEIPDIPDRLINGD